MTNVAILIQGPLQYETIKFLKKSVSYLDEFFPNYDIKISTQTKDKALLDFCKDELRVGVITSETIESTTFSVLNTSNFGNQVLTSKLGMDSFTDEYDYAIKIRTDEFFEDYKPLMEKMENNPEKIICSNYFFRKDYPYHIGDHIIAGSFENLKLFFDSSFNRLYDLCRNFMLFEDMIKNDQFHTYIYNNRNIKSIVEVNEGTAPPESRLAINYLLEQGEHPLCKNHKELMQKYFDVIDVTRMGDFECRSNAWSLQINSENFSNFEHEVLNKKENQCWDCPSFLLCEERERQAMMLALIRSSIKDINELQDLTDDLDIHSSVYRPWTKIKEFNKCIRLR